MGVGEEEAESRKMGKKMRTRRRSFIRDFDYVIQKFLLLHIASPQRRCSAPLLPQLRSNVAPTQLQLGYRWFRTTYLSIESRVTYPLCHPCCRQNKFEVHIIFIQSLEIKILI